MKIDKDVFIRQLSNYLLTKSIKELISITKIDALTLFDWVTGKSQPTEQELIALCKYLDISYSWLYNESADMLTSALLSHSEQREEAKIRAIRRMLIYSNDKPIHKTRCEHNCHLCVYEYLGRCHNPDNGKHGDDVSIGRDYITESAKSATDLPICNQYDYGGSRRHLIEIMYAEHLGKVYLTDEELSDAVDWYLDIIEHKVEENNNALQKLYDMVIGKTDNSES